MEHDEIEELQKEQLCTASPQPQQQLSQEQSKQHGKKLQRKGQRKRENNKHISTRGGHRHQSVSAQDITKDQNETPGQEIAAKGSSSYVHEQNQEGKFGPYLTSCQANILVHDSESGALSAKRQIIQKTKPMTQKLNSKSQGHKSHSPVKISTDRPKKLINKRQSFHSPDFYKQTVSGAFVQIQHGNKHKALSMTSLNSLGEKYCDIGERRLFTDKQLSNRSLLSSRNQIQSPIKKPLYLSDQKEIDAARRAAMRLS